MLITLKSNLLDGSEDNINDANQFTNYFPGGFILKKNSQIGLLNCTYNINEGYVIEGTPLQMKIVVPPDTTEQIRTVAIGSYTGDELAAAIQTSLRTLATMPASNSVWPIAGFTCKFHRHKQEFSIKVPWDPVNELQHTINIEQYARLNGTLKGGKRQLPVQAVSANDQALFYKDSNDVLTSTNSMTSIKSNPGGSDEVFNANAMGLKVPALATANAYFASYEFQATATVGIEARFALSHPNIIDIKFANIQLALDGSGVGATSNVVAYENNTTGQPQKIEFSPVVSAAPNDKFRILIPVQYTGQGTDHNNAIYQKYTNNIWQTLTLTAGAARYTIKGSDSVVFRASIASPGYTDELRSEPSVNLLTKGNGINNFFYDPGSSYILGEQVTFGLGTPAATKAATGTVAAIDANGGITEIELAEIGEGYSVQNDIVITGVESGKTSCTIDIDSITTHAILGTGGTKYVKEDVLTVLGGSQPNLKFKVMEVNNPTDGVITEISIEDNSNKLYTNNTPLSLSNANAGGTGAQISLFNAQSFYPSIKNLRMTGFVSHLENNPNLIHNPLGLQQNCSLDMDTVGPLIGLPGVLNTTINSDSTVAEIDETGPIAKPNTRVANNLLVHLDNFPIRSKHKGGEGRCIAALPYGDGTKAGLFQDRSFNLTYHSLENKSDENHNEIRVRITDAEGGLLQGLLHPTVINLDLRPITI